MESRGQLEGLQPDMAVIGISRRRRKDATPFTVMQNPSRSVAAAIVDLTRELISFSRLARKGSTSRGIHHVPTFLADCWSRWASAIGIGKINALHARAAWTDRPLVLDNCSRGRRADRRRCLRREDPADSVLPRATGQLFRGTSGTVFQAGARD